MDTPHICYTIEEAAKLTSLGRSTIYREIGAGRLIARKMAGRRVVITRDDLEAFIGGLPRATDIGSIKKTEA